MALPPERISIKRRRQDEPVDTLVLEQSNAPNTKRRFTDFFFQRLRVHDDRLTPKESRVISEQKTAISTLDHRQSLGIPVVKASAPGDEIRDFTKYKETQNKRIKESQDAAQTRQSHESSLKAKPNTAGLSARVTKNARRFHLTRDLSTNLKPNPAGGIRRRKINIRPPLATFIERQVPRASFPSQTGKPPKDSIVHVDEADIAATIAKDPSLTELENSQTLTNPFLKSKQLPTRTGRSIRDDPSTWDLQSDQLADELANLAMEMDPELVTVADVDERPSQPEAVQPSIDQMLVDSGDDYVFETYVRVKYDGGTGINTIALDANLGVLVIDEEDEDLWEKYVRESDDDDEWDEEDDDSNAEDNPRNDYPEDEVSSDDEFGYNVYQHRRDASDDEQYDNDKDEW